MGLKVRVSLIICKTTGFFFSGERYGFKIQYQKIFWHEEASTNRIPSRMCVAVVQSSFNSQKLSQTRGMLSQ